MQTVLRVEISYDDLRFEFMSVHYSEVYMYSGINVEISKPHSSEVHTVQFLQCLIMITYHSNIILNKLNPLLEHGRCGISHQY